MSLRFWLRFWFVNSYDLWREHPRFRYSNPFYASWRGCRAAYGGWRQRDAPMSGLPVTRSVDDLAADVREAIGLYENASGDTQRFCDIARENLAELVALAKDESVRVGQTSDVTWEDEAAAA